MGIMASYSTDFKDLQKVYGSLIGTVKVSEEFTNDSELIEKLFNMKEEIKQEFELYA